MAKLQVLPSGTLKNLHSLGRTGAMKNVITALRNISANDKNLKTGNWQLFRDAFEKFGFTVVYDRNMAILITALFAAIARSGVSIDIKNTAGKIINTKISNENLGQALLDGNGEAAHLILNKKEFTDILGTGGIGIDGKYVTKFLNRVKKITPWRLSGSKNMMENDVDEILSKSFEKMTGLECSSGNPLLECAERALVCHKSLIPRFFSCLNSKEAEFLYKKFPNNKREDSSNQLYFSSFEKYLDDIKKSYEDIERVAPHDKQQFLFLMKKVVGKFNGKAYVNIIENIIKTMDNGKYKSGIEYNANTGSKDVNEIVEKYTKILGSDEYQEITWNPTTRNNELAAHDLVDDFKKLPPHQLSKDLSIIFPSLNGFYGQVGLVDHGNNIEILYSSLGDNSYDPDASSGFETFKKYFENIFDWYEDFDRIYENYEITGNRFFHGRLATLSVIEKIVRREDKEEKLRYAAVFQAICSAFPGESKFKIDLDAAGSCSCQHIKDIVRKYKKTISTIKYDNNLKWKSLGKEDLERVEKLKKERKLEQEKKLETKERLKRIREEKPLIDDLPQATSALKVNDEVLRELIKLKRNYNVGTLYHYMFDTTSQDAPEYNKFCNYAKELSKWTSRNYKICRNVIADETQRCLSALLLTMENIVGQPNHSYYRDKLSKELEPWLKLAHISIKEAGPFIYASYAFEAFVKNFALSKGINVSTDSIQLLGLVGSNELGKHIIEKYKKEVLQLPQYQKIKWKALGKRKSFSGPIASAAAQAAAASAAKTKAKQQPATTTQGVVGSSTDSDDATIPMECIEKALTCNESILTQFFSCLKNDKEDESLYTKFPTDKASKYCFTHFKNNLDYIRKYYDSIDYIDLTPKEAFLLIMEHATMKETEPEQCVNVIENIIKTMDNGKYNTGIEYNTDTGYEDINDIIKEYIDILKSSAYKAIKWKPLEEKQPPSNPAAGTAQAATTAAAETKAKQQPATTTQGVVGSSTDSAQSTDETTAAAAEASTVTAETKQQQPQLNSSEGGAKPGSTSSTQEQQVGNPQQTTATSSTET